MTNKNVISFNGANYSEWETATMFYLQGKSLWKVVRDRPMELKELKGADGKPVLETIESAPYLQRVEKMDDQNLQTMGKIGERVAPKFAEQLRKYRSAAEVWDAIREIGQAKSTSNMILVRTEFSSAKMNNGDDVLEHIGNLERCQRLLKDTEAPIKDGELIIRLIGSMPTEWKSYVEGLRANPALLSQYEELRKAIIGESIVRQSLQQSDNARAALNSNYHQRNGGEQSERQHRQKQKFQGTCRNCGKVGHKEADCWAAGGGKEGEGPLSRQKKQAGSTSRMNGKEVRFSLAAGKTSNPDKTWVLDSGATDHMTGDRSAFTTLETIDNDFVALADASKVRVEGVGTIEFTAKIGERSSTFRISKVLYVPGLAMNLMSVSALDAVGAQVAFMNCRAEIRTIEGTVAYADKTAGNLYALNAEIVRRTIHQANAGSSVQAAKE